MGNPFYDDVDDTFRGVRVRAHTAEHTYVLPLALVGVGVWQALSPATLVAAIWIAHIGFDRALGYGLKFPTAFGDTHLGRGGVSGHRRDDSRPETDPTTSGRSHP